MEAGAPKYDFLRIGSSARAGQLEQIERRLGGCIGTILAKSADHLRLSDFYTTGFKLLAPGRLRVTGGTSQRPMATGRAG